MIRVYDEAGNVIETHEQTGEFKEVASFAHVSVNFGLLVSPDPDNDELMFSFYRDSPPE